MRHADRNFTRFGQSVVAQHFVAAGFDAVDLGAYAAAAACGVARQRGVPLREAVADVVEARNGRGQRLGEVGELRLEAADALAALAGEGGVSARS